VGLSICFKLNCTLMTNFIKYRKSSFFTIIFV